MFKRSRSDCRANVALCGKTYYEASYTWVPRWLQSNRTWKNKSEASWWKSLNLTMLYWPLKELHLPLFFVPGKDQQYKAWHESQGDTPRLQIGIRKTLHFSLYKSIMNYAFLHGMWFMKHNIISSTFGEQWREVLYAFLKINWKHNSQSPIRMNFLCLTIKLM